MHFGWLAEGVQFGQWELSWLLSGAKDSRWGQSMETVGVDSWRRQSDCLATSRISSRLPVMIGGGWSKNSDRRIFGWRRIEREVETQAHRQLDAEPPIANRLGNRTGRLAVEAGARSWRWTLLEAAGGCWWKPVAKADAGSWWSKSIAEQCYYLSGIVLFDSVSSQRLCAHR